MEKEKTYGVWAVRSAASITPPEQPKIVPAPE